ncbi:MAG: F0F1 ATP synthase subunit epsilon [Clostridia bacterium]|nr:F0F1 ATP synthase subunit epsilon [Clostridia bacterium]
MATNSVRLEVITPSKLFYRGEVELVIVTTLDGDEGFMAGHVWACKLLDVGELWIQEKGAAKDEWRVAAVAGGFIDVKDSIVIYTDAVEWSEDIDMERVLSEKAKVEDWLGKHPDAEEDSEEMQKAKLMLAKAEVRTNVADGGHRH